MPANATDAVTMYAPSRSSGRGHRMVAYYPAIGNPTVECSCEAGVWGRVCWAVASYRTDLLKLLESLVNPEPSTSVDYQEAYLALKEAVDEDDANGTGSASRIFGNAIEKLAARG